MSSPAPRMSSSGWRRCRVSFSWCMAPPPSTASPWPKARPGRAKAPPRSSPGAAGVTCWRWELARGDQGSTVACAPGMITHEKLTAFLETLPKGELLMRGDSVAFPARRLRLFAQPPGARHPLPDRGRHPHRHPWPLDLVWTGRRLVRIRARRGVRAGRRRQAEPLHPRDDPAARADRQKLDPICQRGRQGQAEDAKLQDLRRRADRVRGRRSDRAAIRHSPIGERSDKLRISACSPRGDHDQHRPPAGFFRHQGGGGRAAARCRAAGSLSRAACERPSPAR